MNFDYYRIFILGCLLFSSNTFAVDIVLGMYATDKPWVMVKKFKPMTDYLGDELSKKSGQQVVVHLKVAKSYKEGIEDIVNGNVDFARLGPASYIEVKEKNPGVKLIAVESKKGEKIFYGIICVQADSDVINVGDLKGKKVAFGNERSTIGRYLSQLYLLENGVKAKDLMSYQYLGRHDRVGIAVSNGAFDAGALKESTFKYLIRKGHKLRSIGKFENKTKPWVATHKVSSELFVAIQEVLLELVDPKVLNPIKKDGFVKGNDNDFNVIRRSLERNTEFFN